MAHRQGEWRKKGCERVCAVYAAGLGRQGLGQDRRGARIERQVSENKGES